MTTLTPTAAAPGPCATVLWYQPVYDAAGGGTPVAFEALVRDGAGDGAGAALARISASGADDELHDWVVATAAGQLARWRAGGHHVDVSVNLPAPALERLGVLAAAAASGCAVELLEGTAFTSPSAAAAVRAALAGTTVWLDDVGRDGAEDDDERRLRAWPGAGVKLDAAASARPAALRSWLRRCRAEGRAVVVEGVEERWQLDVVRHWAQGAPGDVRVQGYLLGRACGPDEAGALLRP